MYADESPFAFQEYAGREGMLFFETSAMDGTNVVEAFVAMLQKILKRDKKVC